MNKKPTHSSLTGASCTCGYLQRAADEPGNPIAFDEQSGEFQFCCRNRVEDDAYPATLVIYHCPFCGGAAPESKRHLLFARIDDSEVDRLADLLAPIQTVADALRLLGNPDTEGFGTSRGDESDDHPSTVERHRHICYKRLSDTAEVWFQVMPDKTVHWQLQGKQLGSAE